MLAAARNKMRIFSPGDSMPRVMPGAPGDAEYDQGPVPTLPPRATVAHALDVSTRGYKTSPAEVKRSILGSSSVLSRSRLQSLRSRRPSVDKALNHLGNLVAADSLEARAQSLTLAGLADKQKEGEDPLLRLQAQLIQMQATFEKRLADVVSELNAERESREALQQRVRILESGGSGSGSSSAPLARSNERAASTLDAAATATSADEQPTKSSSFRLRRLSKDIDLLDADKARLLQAAVQGKNEDESSSRGSTPSKLDEREVAVERRSATDTRPPAASRRLSKDSDDLERTLQKAQQAQRLKEPNEGVAGVDSRKGGMPAAASRRLSKDSDELEKTLQKARKAGVLAQAMDDAPADPLAATVDLLSNAATLDKESAERARRPSQLVLAREFEASKSEMSDGEDPICSDPAIVGIFSCHGSEPGRGGGARVDKINQDCAGVAHPVGPDAQSALFCAFDGHGECGTEVSLAALQTIYDELTFAAAGGGGNGGRLKREPEDTLLASFVKAQSKLKARASELPLEVDARDSGACAIVAYLRDSKVWVAGAGDCRAVLGTRRGGELSALCLSTDHKCDLDSEKQRIESMGGHVRPAAYNGDTFIAPARFYESLGELRKGPGLAISRSLGDLNAVGCGLIPNPEICSHALSPEDKVLILGSDGVWEFIEPQQAVDICIKFFDEGKPAFQACQLLIAKAAMAWRLHEGDYRDDITAIVVYLPAVLEQLRNSEPSAAGGM
jgi:serine/threonine protein phosphatase PrpC